MTADTYREPTNNERISQDFSNRSSLARWRLRRTLDYKVGGVTIKDLSETEINHLAVLVDQDNGGKFPYRRLVISLGTVSGLALTLLGISYVEDRYQVSGSTISEGVNVVKFDEKDQMDGGLTRSRYLPVDFDAAIVEPDIEQHEPSISHKTGGVNAQYGQNAGCHLP